MCKQGENIAFFKNPKILMLFFSQTLLQFAQDARQVALEPIQTLVDSQKAEQKYQSAYTITNSQIQNNSNGNGDVASLLKILPNVQFDNKQMQSTTSGEIAPANISISGGLYYQNLFY